MSRATSEISLGMEPAETTWARVSHRPEALGAAHDMVEEGYPPALHKIMGAGFRRTSSLQGT